MSRIIRLLAVVFFVAHPLVCAAAPVGPDRRSQTIHFTRSATSTAIKGQIKGDRYIDYLVRAGAGQALSVEMQTGNGANYFNILPSGSRDVAMFVGSTSGNRFSGVLPTDGDYTIRVYLMRSAARRNEAAGFTLTVGVTGQTLAATPAARDALLPGTPFHDSATIACVPPYVASTKECEAFVIRRSVDGAVTVEVRCGDVSVVRSRSEERFETPDALVSGG